MPIASRHVIAATLAAIASVSGFLAGCTSMPDERQLRATAAPYPGLALPAARDGRARYRELFCQLAARHAGATAAASACDDLLWRLQDEPARASAAPAPPELARRMHVFVVSGAFSDCRQPATVPFEDAITSLGARGLRIQAVMVSGRSGPAHNARQIAHAIATADIADGEHVVLVGYSKGAVDALQYVVEFPEQARHVAAVLSIAGAVQGSPLAERGDWWYRTFLDHAFADTCDPGDGQVIQSLLPSVRKAWLAAHPLPPHVAYFSLPAFTTEEHLSQGLKLPWRTLARHDQRNDGQVVAVDAIIPDSTVLGYANADHWDLAIMLEQQMPQLSARKSDRQFPRSAVLEAALLYISESLAAATPPMLLGQAPEEQP
jgi:hypothetical protein